jgi:hypothetical protein
MFTVCTNTNSRERNKTRELLAVVPLPSPAAQTTADHAGAARQSGQVVRARSHSSMQAGW